MITFVHHPIGGERKYIHLEIIYLNLDNLEIVTIQKVQFLKIRKI